MGLVFRFAVDAFIRKPGALAVAPLERGTQRGDGVCGSGLGPQRPVLLGRSDSCFCDACLLPVVSSGMCFEASGEGGADEGRCGARGCCAVGTGGQRGSGGREGWRGARRVANVALLERARDPVGVACGGEGVEEREVGSGGRMGRRRFVLCEVWHVGCEP